MNRTESRGLFRIALVLLLVAGIRLQVCAQLEEVEISPDWVMKLSNYRNALLNDEVASLDELGGLLSKWDALGANKQEQIDFTYNVLKVRAVDGWSFRLIKKKALLHQPGIIADSFSEADLRIIEAHPDLLDMVFLGVLEWKYPFAIDREAAFFRALGAYEISGGERIGEIGSGTGVFSLMLKLLYPDITLHVNELDRDFVKYITLKFENGIGDLENSGVETIKGRRESTNLEGYELDKIILRNTLHHFGDQDEMLGSIKRSLKPGGELFVWESIVELDIDDNICKHALTREAIKGIFEDSAFELLGERDFEESVLFKLRRK